MNKGDIMIRKANKFDTFDIDEVHIESYKETYKEFITPEVLNNMDSKRTQRIKDMIEEIKHENPYLVAIEDDRIVGVLKYGKSNNKVHPESAEINAIYLREECQGKGTGTKLFNECIKEVSIEYDDLVVSCLDKEPANEFYKKLGGKLDHQITEDGLTENVYYFSNIKELNKTK